MPMTSQPANVHKLILLVQLSSDVWEMAVSLINSVLSDLQGLSLEEIIDVTTMARMNVDKFCTNRLPSR